MSAKINDGAVVGLVIAAAVGGAAFGVFQGGKFIWRKITRNEGQKERPLTDEDIRRRLKEVMEETIRKSELDEQDLQKGYEEMMAEKRKKQEAEDKNETDTTSSSDDEQDRQRRKKKNTK